MSLNNKFTEEDQAKSHSVLHEVEMDPVLTEALSQFRSSMHSWSEAAYQRQRTVTVAASRGPVWRKLTAGAMGLALVVGAATTGLYEYRHQQEAARLAAARAAEQKRELAAEKAREAEDLLAKVDNDVSQEVPTAMEPLASLMTDNTQ